MDKRSFLKTMSVGLGAAVPGLAAAASARGYDPAAGMAVKVSEVEYRRTAKGRSLLARVYQPQGKGPFPGARPARRGLERQGSLCQRADEPCGGGERRGGCGH